MNLNYMQSSAIKKKNNFPYLYESISVIQKITEKIPIEKITMGTGFGAPGVVLLDILSRVNAKIRVFYIDTGFLFNETYLLKEKLQEYYNVEFTKISSSTSVTKQKEIYGDNLWNTDPHLCCNIRKVLPLKNALKDFDVWITGIRKSQTKLRQNSKIIEYDKLYNVTKINPLINWTHDQIWKYIQMQNIPYNELHDKGYPSLGCFHCTTATKNGEDERAGRWRGTDKTECGLHFGYKNGKIKPFKNGKTNGTK